jgi:hypothetical protein
MKSSRTQRWDLVVGVGASLVAIFGFGLSMAIGNTTSVGFGNVQRETQNFLAVVAGMFLILVAIKAGFRYRSARQGVCGWSIERLIKRSRRRP